MTCAQISNVTANYCRAEEYEQRIAQLEAENAALKAERDDLLETLTDVTNQACRMSDGTLDSMALSANASAMHTLADHGVIVIDADYGRRVIGHYPEVKS